MSRTGHICLMATYNEWMNEKVYQAARKLPDEELAADRKAFFGSILGTLNHVAVGDVIWLKRFAEHPVCRPLTQESIRGLPTAKNLDHLLFENIRELSEYRVCLDRIIIGWAGSLTETDLDHTLNYTSMKGVPADKNFHGLIMHFFNHQTHHRGQVTTLLSQAGVDVGDTDLVAFIPYGSGK
ncbi:DinB family protein [Pseudomonas fluorescens]|uniref:DinB family protein n=1 Tax=Pseudomonas fluorescens TaxID=294 RepID=UPI003F97203A